MNVLHRASTCIGSAWLSRPPPALLWSNVSPAQRMDAGDARCISGERASAVQSI